MVPQTPQALLDLVELRGAGDELPLVSELDPYRLKATPSEYGDSSRYGINDPYVPRTHGDVDRRVAAALAGDRLVLLIGPSKAGKTRTLFEAVRRELPTARVVVPDRTSIAELPACEEFRTHADTLVVWLEDIDEFTRSDRPLTPRLFAALTARSARTVVVATVRSEKYEELLVGGELARDIRTVFEQANRIELAPTSDSETEQAAAAERYPSVDLTRYGLAEMLVGAPALLARYRRGRTTSVVSAQVAAYSAVVEVVIDWARIGRLDRIPEDRLTQLARDVVDTRYSAYDIAENDLTTAIAEARRPQEGTGQTTAIDSEWLTNPRIRGYRPFDYLVAADDIDNPRPIPDAYWHRATADADIESLIAVGIGALYRGLPTTAETLFRRAADLGDADAMFHLGLSLWEQGEIDEAETWYYRAADAGQTAAMNNLGLLLKKRGEVDEAETWFRRGADAGQVDAMNNLGLLLEKRGAIGEAETWYHHAADLGDADATTSFFSLLLDQLGDEVGEEDSGS